MLINCLRILAICLLFLSGVTSPAFAEAPQCRGTDLLAKLKKEAPEEYRRIEAEARRIPNGSALFWKIEKKGLRPSYLLGTMHVNDRRILDVPKSVRKRYLASKVVVLESVSENMTQAIALSLSKPDIMMMPHGRRLQDFLTEHDRPIVEAALKAKGMSLFAVDYLRPWVIATAFPPATCFAPGTKKNAAFLDQQILDDASEHGVRVQGLETLDEQHAAMANMSMEAQIQALMEALTADEGTRDIFETMISIYKSGNPGLVRPFLSRHSSSISLAGSDASQFEAHVITKRNHVMAERSATFLAAGKAFIAVGALHLQGEEGLVELFRRQGYKVTAVK